MQDASFEPADYAGWTLRRASARDRSPPEQRKVTLYMEVTGTTAPINHVDLVARVQGFLDKVGYKDGAAVKKGDLLFQIDKQDFEIALQIAQATQAQARGRMLALVRGRTQRAARRPAARPWAAAARRHRA